MRIFCFEKNMYLNSIKNDHADGCRSGCGLIRSILGILELSSEKNHSFITIWKSWFSYEFPLPLYSISAVLDALDSSVYHFFGGTKDYPI